MEKENQKTQEIESEEAFELAAPQQQQVVKPEDFDWDAYENGSVAKSRGLISFLKALPC